MKFLLAQAFALLLLLPVFALAEPAPSREPAPANEPALYQEPSSTEPAEAEPGPLSEDLSQELARQAELIDLSPWQRYFSSASPFFNGSFATLDELLLGLSEGTAESSPQGLFDTVKALAEHELRSSLGAAAALAAAALLTALPALLPTEGVRPVLGLALMVPAVCIAASAFAALIKTASSAVGEAGEFTRRSLPVMTALLTAVGSTSSEGLFRPLMSFLAGTVITAIERLVMPLCAACGVLRIADSVAGGGRLSELVGLAKKAVRWLLGLISAFYFGVAAVRGLTAASRDGLALRTARYAIDQLVPVVGSMVSGTVDGVLACALLIKNGAGVMALLLLFSFAAKPLLSLAAGMLVFRAAAAVSRPAADPRVVGLYSGLADTASELFACAAAAVLLNCLTVCVFIASGGVAAGLW